MRNLVQAPIGRFTTRQAYNHAVQSEMTIPLGVGLAVIGAGPRFRSGWRLDGSVTCCADVEPARQRFMRSVWEAALQLLDE